MLSPNCSPCFDVHSQIQSTWNEESANASNGGRMDGWMDEAKEGHHSTTYNYYYSFPLAYTVLMLCRSSSPRPYNYTRSSLSSPSSSTHYAIPWLLFSSTPRLKNSTA